MRKLTLILIFLCLPAYAEQGGEMILFKEPPYYAPSPSRMYSDDCNGLFHVKHDYDVADLRDFPLFFCDGKYTLTLEGPAGKVATVFARFHFKTESGFLIIRKTDDKMVWILDLEKFPDRQWQTVEAKGEYGGYEAFYRAAPAFERNLASVKWGQWWGKPEDLGTP